MKNGYSTSVEISPWNEDCPMVGSVDYPRLSQLYASTMVEQLMRSFDCEDVQFEIKRNEHDLGDYLDICCWTEVESKEAISKVNRIEDQFPESWDEIAIHTLKAANAYLPTSTAK
jgi:hypothetical protein